MIFQLLEIMKKIYIFYKEKRKKNLVQILNGLLPNCVLRRGIVLQYWILYCRDLGLKGKNCIAIGRLYCDREVGWKGIVLQGQVLYRDTGSLASREVSCDTARCRATIQHAGRTAGAQERRGSARGAQQER